MKKIMLGIWLVIAVLGCEYGPPRVDPIPGGPAYIELRASAYQIKAPADSTAQISITAIVRDYQGVAYQGAEVTYSTTPPVLVGLPSNSISNENGEVLFRLSLLIPIDTTQCIVTARSGYVVGRRTLELIGE